jgi:hypothetical protein
MLTAHEGQPGKKGWEARRKVVRKMDYCLPSNLDTPMTGLDSLWGGTGEPFSGPCRTTLWSSEWTIR